jgi:hypothetical protein
LLKIGFSQIDNPTPVAVLQRERGLLVREPELLRVRPDRDDVGRGRPGPHQGDRLVHVVAADGVRVALRHRCAPALLCPLVDLTGGHVHDRPPGSGPPVVTSGLLRELGALYLAGHPVDDAVVAPLHADLTGLPPLLVQAGTGDTVVAEGRALAGRAREHGVEVDLQLYPADTHVFHMFWPFLAEAGRATAAVGEFVGRAAAPDASSARTERRT